MKKEAGSKKTRVTEQDCRLAELLLRGKAPIKEVAQLVGKDQTTISRMKKAGFDLEKYNEMTRARKERYAKEPEEEREPEVPGQIAMELPTAEEPKPEMSDQVKLMRFQAAQTEKVLEKITAQAAILNDTQLKVMEMVHGIGVKIEAQTAVLNETLITKLDQIYNMTGMILRAIRKE